MHSTRRPPAEKRFLRNSALIELPSRRNVAIEIREDVLAEKLAPELLARKKSWTLRPTDRSRGSRGPGARAR